MSQPTKTRVIAFQRDGHATAYIRSLGRDGSWLCTWDIEHARRFTADLAEQKVRALNAATACAVFEHRDAGPA